MKAKPVGSGSGGYKKPTPKKRLQSVYDAPKKATAKSSGSGTGTPTRASATTAPKKRLQSVFDAPKKATTKKR